MALLSWIEKDGALFYITDKEYTSKEWKNKMVMLLHNDAVGHGATRQFYQFGGGNGYEVRDFWILSKLPTELQQKVIHFEDNFKILFQNCMTKDDLKIIILNASVKWRTMAWNQLKKQKPTKEELIYLLDFMIK